MQLKISVFLITILYTAMSFAQPFDPVANPAAVVHSGKARFTVLTDRVIRMEYSNDGNFVDQASLTFVIRNLPVPVYQKSEEGGWLIIKTKFCTLRYRPGSGPFTAENLSIKYNDSKHSFTWKPGMKDKKNLKGTARTLDGVIGTYSTNDSTKLKLGDGILSRSGWALIDDSERPLFDNSDWPWVQPRDSAELQDLYFFGYGSNYKAALYDYTQVAGRISLPPLFAFGIWYSRYWAYTEAQFKEIVADYQRYNIPLDVLVIDMDWHLTWQSSPEVFKRFNPQPSGWTGFTWEKKYFPDYKEFLSWTDAQKLQTCMNIHPAAGVGPHEAAYPAFAAAMGADTSKHASIPFDITDKKFAENYFNILLHPYEKDGVDFWWLDWQQWGHTKMKGVNPTFYLNYLHFSDMQRQGKRPLIFHRYGGLGNHRYEIGFSGDCIIDWKSLTYQPVFTATASNVCFGFWSHDIGGHYNSESLANKQNPEIFTRWVEWGAFSPIFRTHATNDSTIDRRIWKYPEANFNAMRKAIQQRYALLPYIYTMARYAYDSGISLIRPMYYEFPELSKAYKLPHQYYFGNNMIVSPITKSMNGKETARQTVWLPEGDWYDFRDNNLITGGKNFTGEYKLDEIPVFVRAGSIIPMQTPKLRITGSVLDTLILTVYPAETATFSLYEDEGNNENYRKNICSFTHFTFHKTTGAMNLKIEPDGKTFTGQVTERSYEIRIVATGSKPKEIKVNGKSADWSYDEANKVITIRTKKERVGEMEVEVD